MQRKIMGIFRRSEWHVLALSLRTTACNYACMAKAISSIMPAGNMGL